MAVYAGTDEGHSMKLMNVEVGLTGMAVYDGVSFELYTGSDVAVIRVMDCDSRKVVSLKRYPDISRAGRDYRELCRKTAVM